MLNQRKKPSYNKVNQKGFSLVELLIVIAIMGVLSVIAFNAFSGIYLSAREKADRQTAKNIETALRTFVTDSGIIDPGSSKRIYSTLTGTTPISDITPTPEGAKKLLTYLMNPIYILDTTTNIRRVYGPYLEKSSETADYMQYSPQWNLEAGGQNIGWQITITKSTNSVVVTPSIADYGITIK